MNKVRIRESNFELLRILCMLGVLTSHVLQNCYPGLHSGDFSWQNILRILLMNISIVAVNCFVMISGYFRIKQSVRSFLSLYLQLVFYCGIFSLIGLCLGKDTLFDSVVRTLFPFTEGGMWFMVAYLALFLIAPILNAAYNSFDKSQRSLSLIALLIIDVYLGYMHQSKEITLDGYHVVHFITIYYLGMYLSETQVNSNVRWGFLWIVNSMLMTVLHGVKMVFFPISIIYAMRYNSPMLFLASFLLFQWVRTWKLRSSKINWVAVSVLSVYVIHSQPIVAEYFFDSLQNISCDETISSILTAIIMILSSLALYAICIILDKLRITLMIPVVNQTALWWDKKKTCIRPGCDDRT